MLSKGMRYFIKKPAGLRKTFALVHYAEADKLRTYYPLAPNLALDLAAINASFLSGMPEYQALALVKDLVDKQHRATNVRAKANLASTLSKTNQNMFEEFWHDVYSARFLRDEAAARYRLLKALRLIEPLSLHTASDKDLIKRLKGTCKDYGEMRYAIDRLNQLLRYLKRDVVLRKPPAGPIVVRHLMMSDFILVLAQFADPISRALAVTLCSSGARLSEAMAFLESDLGDGDISITKQLTKLGLSLPKAGKTGRAAMLNIDLQAVKLWIGYKNKEKYRDQFARDLRKACRLAFPHLKDREKWVSPHDLRHSYAINCRSIGLSTDDVADSLRNTSEVAKRFYIGFGHSEGSLDRAKSIIAALNQLTIVKK